MKKQLLCLSLVVSSFAIAQTPSPDWSINQSTNFPYVSAGTRYLDAVNSNVLWIIGYDGFAASRNYNSFSRSINGGTSFNVGKVFPDTNTYVVSSIEGIDANTAWVTAYLKSSGSKGVIYKTNNGGTTWTNGGNSTMFSNATSFANLTCFTSTNTGITMGDPKGGEFEIYRTTDAGATWSVVPGANIPNPSSTTEYGFVDVYTKFGSHIWFGTSTGRVFHSLDDGLNWTVGTVTGATAGVTALAFTDANNGLAYGYAGTVFGLYSTNNGGNTWTALPVPVELGMNDICAIPGTNNYASCGAATGNTVLSYSADHGLTWIDWGSFGIQYLKIDFANLNSGWVGTFSDPTTSSIGGLYKYNGTILSTNNFDFDNYKFNIYPSPSNGQITIDLPISTNKITIEIIDVLGKSVYSDTANEQVANSKKQINLDFLPKGVYTITFKNRNEVSVKKIILQ